MSKFYMLLLGSLPFCLAQFSIQGPSDGNRVAQGLKYSQEKGIEYDQRGTSGSGGFSIQGATDGNSNFQIQGATDGHSDFAIQGASVGGAEYAIQGATDGHSQSSIQGPYDANQDNQRSLQYNDPSGLRVNWRSYAHERQAQQAQQAQPAVHEQQYVPTPRGRHHQRAHEPQQQAPAAAQGQQYQVQTPLHPPNYRTFEKAPDRIKQLLQFQAQIPYMNIIPEPFRYDEAAALKAQQEQVRAFIQGQYQDAQTQSEIIVQDQQRHHPTSQQQPKSRGRSRDKRQAPQYQGGQYQGGQYQGAQRQAPQHQVPQQQQQHQQYQQPEYTRISQPAPEAQPQYSTNVPSSIQELLKFQSQIPYHIIANQIVYQPDKPYVPQPVQHQQQAASEEVQYRQAQQPQTHGQGFGPYQPPVRPVTENQY
ncbi:chromatin modification-related protein eaf-1 [Orussus abietinus]|uniref:chromatin modification-related protein eaf-1 n=1 Tax=Orussus abietinus TaxID=222816 RepID=UPI0006257CDE|nr:chromatin modification-related protein eaf-1 [Orussus abietinus]